MLALAISRLATALARGLSNCRSMPPVERVDCAATEVSSLASYQAARMSLDQTLGITLEANHVSIDEAKAGKVERVSAAPANP